MPEARKHLLLVEDEAALRETLAERLAEQVSTSIRRKPANTPSRSSPNLPSTSSSPTCGCPGSTARACSKPRSQRYPDIIGIIVTGYGTVKDAVEAIKRGATDFVTKPFQFDELLHALNSAMEQRRLKAENAYLRSQLQERYRFEGLIGRSSRDARPVSAARNGVARRPARFS